ncbi:MAG: RNA polymerase sigma factor [Bacteroidales bacterium]
MQLDIEKSILQIQKGDSTAFKTLVEEYQQYAFKLAFRIVCNEDDAMDVVQESFIKIWKKINTYKPEIKFTTWMYKIISNTAIDKLRSIKRNNHINIDDVSLLCDRMSNEHPDVQVDNIETGQLIRTISESLPEKQKLVFILKDLQGMDSNEVENILNMNETSVKSNLYHARKGIREKLNKLLSYERRFS